MCICVFVCVCVCVRLNISPSSTHCLSCSMMVPLQTDDADDVDDDDDDDGTARTFVRFSLVLLCLFFFLISRARFFLDFLPLVFVCVFFFVFVSFYFVCVSHWTLHVVFVFPFSHWILLSRREIDANRWSKKEKKSNPLKKTTNQRDRSMSYHLFNQPRKDPHAPLLSELID